MHHCRRTWSPWRSPCLACCPLTPSCASLQNNVGNLISKLEKEFNVQLLIRTKGMPPQATPAGALLLRYADRLLTLGSDAVAAAKDLQDITMGTMTVAASQTTGVYLMPTLIGQRGHLNAACLVLAAALVQADGCLCVSASTRCLIRCTSLMALSCDEAVRADTRCSCPWKWLCTSCWACYLQKSICPWNTAASNGLWACLARSGCSLPSAAQHCCCDSVLLDPHALPLLHRGLQSLAPAAPCLGT